MQGRYGEAWVSGDAGEGRCRRGTRHSCDALEARLLRSLLLMQL